MPLGLQENESLNSPPVEGWRDSAGVVSSSENWKLKTKNCILLAGPTASGKTAIAEWIARNHPGFEILSADSMQVYRGMDIGTAKPSLATRKEIRYHGLDLANPNEPFSTGLWLDHATKALQECTARGNRMIVVGGTGLYFRALLQGIDASTADTAARARGEALLASGGMDALRAEIHRLDPDALATLNADDSRNPRRLLRLLEKLATPSACTIHHSPLTIHHSPLFLLSLPSAILRERIAQRIEQIFASGLLDETRALLAAYPDWEKSSLPSAHAIGYAEAIAVLRGNMTEPKAKELIAIRTSQYARRQRTFFRHQLSCTSHLAIPAPDNVAEVERRAQEMMTVGQGS